MVRDPKEYYKLLFRNSEDLLCYEDLVSQITDKGLKKHHYSTSELLTENYVKVLPFKSELPRFFKKVSSSLGFFNHYYFKIHKKMEIIEFMKYSFSNDLNEVCIIQNNYDKNKIIEFEPKERQ